MTASYFPLRWESTGDQWWYASPIDLAAANGHYDLDNVWETTTNSICGGAGNKRSKVAKKLLLAGEPRNNNGCNSLIRAGYGGWLLYTAASAGDLEFVKELLKRDPLLVFGEGEYGVTDILYAAARSGNLEVFEVLVDFSLWSKGEEIGSVFKMEMMNRVVHAGAREHLFHIAVIENIHSDLVELLMTVRYIDLNIRDVDGMTPLDLLRQRPKSMNSEILIKRLISAGGISDYNGYMTRTALVSHLKTHGIGGSPGTSFRVPDAEIIFYICTDKDKDKELMYSGELSQFSSPARSTHKEFEI
ncbi:ankyrin repeat family protein [Tanacetum coccineum]